MYVHGKVSRLESSSTCDIHEPPFCISVCCPPCARSEAPGCLERAGQNVSVLLYISSFSEVFLISSENAPDFVVCQAK